MPYELHLVSNGEMALDQFAAVAGEVAPYVDAIHLREKRRTAAELFAAVEMLLRAGVPRAKLIVNDRADVAWAARVGGVHLAHHSLPVQAVRQMHGERQVLRIGRSVHEAAEARIAARDGADYICFGHVYPSASKLGLPARGLAALAEVTGSVAIPVLAIGGIEPRHVPELLQHGAAGIAVMSGIWDAPRPIEAARQYRMMLQIGAATQQ